MCLYCRKFSAFVIATDFNRNVCLTKKYSLQNKLLTLQLSHFIAEHQRFKTFQCMHFHALKKSTSLLNSNNIIYYNIIIIILIIIIIIIIMSESEILTVVLIFQFVVSVISFIVITIINIITFKTKLPFNMLFILVLH